jgi:hypothetical protein
MFNVLRLIYVQIGDSGVIRWEVIGQAMQSADSAAAQSWRRCDEPNLSFSRT